ncbi:gamma-glutamyltransferase family protein [Limnohabitans sp.]|uniref:gamma-glutamyltransferase family protein n=1 Tax=Limnohabitans sp. TaxID=1907725 RepID=UPI0038B72CE9
MIRRQLGHWIGGWLWAACTWGQALALTSSATTLEPPSAAPLQPEMATGWRSQSEVVSPHWAVVAAHPLATQAGYDILQAGGSAVDAAVAVQMVLTLVEPQSSGLGGGALLLHSQGTQVQAFDGRETAPAAARENLFLNAQGQALPFYQAVVGGRAVGTPGVLRMLALAHQQHGQLPWARLFDPAIRLATQGFAISPRLHAQLKADPYLRLDPTARAYFYQADGQAHPVGHRLRNPPLAKLLTRIAQEGVSAFYSGEVAQAMVDKVQQHPSNPGHLSLVDLARYQPVVREPLCFVQALAQRRYRVCGFPPPSSGTLAIGQLLGLLQHSASGPDALRDGVPTPDWLHVYSEASRLVYADRAQYVGDPAFVSAPGGDWQRLLNPDYLRERSRLIGPTRRPQVTHGTPVRGELSQFAPSLPQPEYGTSHLSIVDGQGHAVAMTTTIESAFGARQMVHGFLLNNELTDFSFVPRNAQGQAVANRVEPGKRPRSSMSPLLVFDPDSGELLMSLGSPGGEMIIHFTAKVLLGVLQWGLTPQQAVDLPNFGNLGGPMVLETQRFSAASVEALRTRGGEVQTRDLTSGAGVLVRQVRDGRAVWVGASDPRREGLVMGP